MRSAPVVSSFPISVARARRASFWLSCKAWMAVDRAPASARCCLTISCWEERMKWSESSWRCAIDASRVLTASFSRPGCCATAELMADSVGELVREFVPLEFQLGDVGFGGGRCGLRGDGGGERESQQPTLYVPYS